jgi:hypothetical protein
MRQHRASHQLCKRKLKTCEHVMHYRTDIGKKSKAVENLRLGFDDLRAELRSFR